MGIIRRILTDIAGKPPALRVRPLYRVLKCVSSDLSVTGLPGNLGHFQPHWPRFDFDSLVSWGLRFPSRFFFLNFLSSRFPVVSSVEPTYRKRSYPPRNRVCPPFGILPTQ